MKQVQRSQSGFSHVMALAAVVVTAGVVGTFVVVRSHAASCVQYVYSYGVNGSRCVKDIQALTNYHTQYTTPKLTSAVLTVDGNYGSKTKAAVIAVQKHWGLTQDGVVGPKTWQVLCATPVNLNMGGGGIPTGYPLSAARDAGCNI